MSGDITITAERPAATAYSARAVAGVALGGTASLEAEALAIEP